MKPSCIVSCNQNCYTTVAQTLPYEHRSQRIEVGAMNRSRADTVVGGVVAAVLVIGGVLSLQVYQQQQAYDRMGSMMGGSMGMAHGPNPLWYLLGTVLISALVGGGYLAIWDEVTGTTTADQSHSPSAVSPEPATVEPSDGDTESTADINPETQPQARVLDLLPEDGRQILEPILSSPGLTQIELRDRADFSKSKVSQTVSGLEKRGLLYRERQGRTYRIYPSDDLTDGQR